MSGADLGARLRERDLTAAPAALNLVENRSAAAREEIGALLAEVSPARLGGDARPDTLIYFHVEDRAAVDAVARAYGVEACAWEWGMYEAHLTDPAGNRVRVGCGA